MQRAIGVKEVNFKPMTRQEYNDFRGWELPADENGDDKGFIVEYIDGGKANTAEYANYVSWSPADVFERAYRPVTGMTFGLAIEALKMGKRIARDGWNGKGLSVTAHDTGCCNGIKNFFIIYPNGDWFPWHPSPTDMLAEDWMVSE